MEGAGECAEGTGEHAGEIFVEPVLGEELFHGALEPLLAVTVAEPLFQERFEHAGSTVRVIPHQML